MLAMRDIVSYWLPFSIMPVTGFVFSMFSGSAGEKAGFLPFVCNNFSGLGICGQGGHPVCVYVARRWPFD